ncbi:EscU/YscU/HrcU family type III secretion system export apparatus switch protein [Paracidovorax cattleyae]|uniref:Flagellar biosynthetic protein FlhB n=2 Tax=Pseudomonadota TaxID=1224 RepID=A0A1H0TSM3_9BURK|nr:EscU/YscU/HrcU family type III secretion system export apparatus switch protein [Paracidovorax cattleyae]AVS75915.1 flagellar type III secretion system protein FlhB [Paracidovorax cattleyae]MBF9266744.1 EscU/YscU/HrcU family type III secretion system export apparatus switch protein [Paracidovorax cattleyae]SDP56576.1 flagellar biosynthetic protein FlhB [Paracidovorax cattleyae]
MDSSSQDKQLPATERKLQQAREEGQAARSRDLSHLAVLGMGAVSTYALAPTLIEHLQRAIAHHLSFNAETVHSTGSMLQRLQDMAFVGVAASFAFALLTAVAAVASAIGSGGWLFTFKPVMPNFSRVNPISGFSNLFSKQQMVTVIKMVLMTGILTAVAWSFMSTSIEKIAMLVLQPSPVALRYVAEWITGGMALLLLVVFLAALIDVPLQAFFFKSRQKMSHEEVKQEHKQSEGSPEVKGRQRQRAREIANRASLGNVAKADFVVMNPTHYAVALRYDEASMGAPQVVSKGTDLLAFKIRELANQHSVPVLQSPMLARALYANAELEQPIPAQLYAAVAQILAYVYRLKAALRGEGRMPDAQPDPYVPPELDPLTKAAPSDASTAGDAP